MTILSNGHQWKYSEFIDNKNYSFDKKQILNSISKKKLMMLIIVFQNGKDMLLLL